MKIEKFWLKQSNLLEWYQKPSFAFKKKKHNYVDWYSDGKINIFDNCVSKNIRFGLGKKIALSHGDMFCIDDTEYQTFKKQVRSPKWKTEFLNKSLVERKSIASSMRDASKKNSSQKDLSSVWFFP